MATSSIGWISRHRWLVSGLFVVLVLVIATETFLLYQQSVVDRASKAQSEKLLNYAL